MISSTANARATTFLLGLVALEAAWIDFGRLHRSQNADSLLLVLVSLQKWTAFYWEQDRLGMLVPLITSIIRHPMANLLVQGWITTSAALVSPFLAARYLLDDWHDWMSAGAVTNVLLLLLATPEVQFDWFVNQPYGTSFALGCAGLLVLERLDLASRLVAVICIVVSHWVNEGVFFLLALLVLSGPRHRRKVPALSLLSIGIALSRLTSSFADAPHTPSALTPLAQWPSGWLELGRKAMTVFGSWPLLISAVSMSLVAAAVAAGTRGGRHALRASASCLVVAVGYGLLVGTFEWVKLNMFYPRYVFPSLMWIGLALAIVSMAAFRVDARAKIALAVSLLIVVTLMTAGTPSLRAIERDFDDRFGRMSADVLDSGARVIGGDYWTVWPAVFHANLVLARQHSSAMVYGLAYRSSTTDAIWRGSPPPTLLLTAPHDASIADRAARANVSIDLVEHRPAVDLYRVTAR